jgi:hypothetical protein
MFGIFTFEWLGTNFFADPFFSEAMNLTAQMTEKLTACSLLSNRKGVAFIADQSLEVWLRLECLEFHAVIIYVLIAPAYRYHTRVGERRRF